MKKDPKIFLHHILESVEAIESHVAEFSKSDFSHDVKTQDAVVRRIEIIGEAVKNLPADFKKRHPEIEWREIAGMCDKLIHEYFGVNLNVVWEAAKTDAPKLKKQILELLKQTKGQSQGKLL